jgi:hypothetical protein
MKKTIIGLSLVIFFMTGCNTKQNFESEISKYSGDGEIKNISFENAPITGYSITFDEFDLNQDFSKEYTLKGLSTKENNPMVYLAVKDDQDYWRDDEKLKNLESRIDFKLSKSNGDEVMAFNSYLRDMFWAGFGLGHKLHSSRKNDSDAKFTAEEGETYTLKVNYFSDEKMEGFKGFIYISSGGYK